MKKSFIVLITVLMPFTVFSQTNQKKYVDLQNNVFNPYIKSDWGQPDANISDEFNTLTYTKLLGNDTNYYLINGKWRWFWASYGWAGEAYYNTLSNISLDSVNNITDSLNPSNKYINLFVKNQTVNLTANPMYPVVMNYSVSRLFSGPTGNLDPGHQYRFGYFEMRCRIPKARYAWPSFWLWGSGDSYSNYNEIDVFELGSNDQLVNTNHFEVSNKRQQKAQYVYAMPGQIFGNNWVTYAVKWEPNKIIWYINNKPVNIIRNIDSIITGDGATANIKIPQSAMNLLAGNVCNFEWMRYNMEQPTQYPNSLDIDYIRVYQRFQQDLPISQIPPDIVFNINGIECGNADSATYKAIYTSNKILNASESYSPNHQYTIIIKSGSATLANVTLTDGGTYNSQPVNISTFDLNHLCTFTQGNTYKVIVRASNGNITREKSQNIILAEDAGSHPAFSINGISNLNSTSVNVIQHNYGKPAIILDITDAKLNYNCNRINIQYWDGLTDKSYSNLTYFFDNNNIINLEEILKNNDFYFDNPYGGFYTLSLPDWSSAPELHFSIAPCTSQINFSLKTLSTGLLKNLPKSTNSIYTVSPGDDIILSKVDSGAFCDNTYDVTVYDNYSNSASGTFQLLSQGSDGNFNYIQNISINGVVENFSIGNFNIRKFCSWKGMKLEPSLTYNVNLSIGETNITQSFIIDPSTTYPVNFLLYTYEDWCNSMQPQNIIISGEKIRLFSPNPNTDLNNLSISSISIDRSYTLKIEDLIQNKVDSFELSDTEIYKLKTLGYLSLNEKRFKNIVLSYGDNKFVPNTYKITLKNYTASTLTNFSSQPQCFNQSSKIVTIYPEDRNLNIDTLDISENKIIDVNDTVILASSLMIKTGKTLTVKGEIQFNKNCRLIVEPGAKLIIDGGTIIANHFDYKNRHCTWDWYKNDVKIFWYGIEALGNSQLTQSDATHAVVELRNGAKIERATNAITLKDGAILRTIGIGNTFTNNVTAIIFETYNKVNLSYINNCTFETTSDFPADTIPSAFIKLSSIKAIKLKGNSFINSSSVSDLSLRGKGIISNNSYFSLTGFCRYFNPYEPCNDIRNVFENLYYAIEANNYSESSILIKETDFNNNLRAIWFNGINNAKIQFNNFNVNQSWSGNYSYGIYIENSKNFTLSQNQFNGLAGSMYGAYISDCGTDYASVYKNIFSNLIIGIQLSSNNSGLQIKCNNFLKDIEYNIWISSGNVSQQGTCNSDITPANNIFTSSKAPDGDIYLDWLLTPFTYTFKTSTLQTEPIYTSTNITKNNCSNLSTTFDYNISCPSPGLITISQKKNQMIVSGNQLTVLTSKIDGGNTQDLLNAVYSRMSPGNLKNKLLAAGPYLSDTVLLATIKRTNKLPAGILKEIIVPNSPITTKVMSAIQTISPALPSGVLTEINNIQTGTSARYDIEQQILYYKNIVDESTNDVIQYYLYDTTVVNANDSLLLFLQSMNTLDSKKQLIQIYLSENRCAEAQTLLAQIPQTNNEDVAFYNFYSILKAHCLSGDSLIQLTAQEESTVRTIANGTTMVAANAQALLMLLYGEQFPETFEIPEYPDSLNLHAKLISACSNTPISNQKIYLVRQDSTLQAVLLPFTTAPDGNFTIPYFDMLLIGDSLPVGFATAGNIPVENFELKTIPQWQQTLNLTIKASKPEVSISLSAPILCFGDTAILSANVTGGIPPYTYNWSTGDTTSNIKFQTSNNYSVIVNDSAGCKDTAYYNLTVPEQLTASFAHNILNCFGDTLSLISSVSGGIQPYSYLWNFGNDNSSSLENPNYLFTNSGLQTISLSVNDKNNCNSIFTRQLTVPDAINIEFQKQDIVCSTGNYGSISTSVSGGTAPYTFNWSNGATTSNIQNLLANNYTLSVTDLQGCKAINSITIEQINDPGTVINQWKISKTSGNFNAPLTTGNMFGTGSACIGDLDGDGIKDLITGASFTNSNTGVAYLLFMNANHTVKSYRKLSSPEIPVSAASLFGQRVDTIGDIDNDGRTEIAIGAEWDGDGGAYHGATWIISLNTDGTVKWYQKISDTQGNFTAPFAGQSSFGSSAASIGDFDNDGINDIVVGARRMDSDKGAIYLLYMNTNGTVKSYTKIGDGQSGFNAGLNAMDQFGNSVANLGDLDGDGIIDLAVGAYQDSDDGSKKGAVWILFLNANATVKSYKRISDYNFAGTIDPTDYFGMSVEYVNKIDDINGDGVVDLIVGAVFDDDGGTNTGALWVLFLNSDATVNGYQKISKNIGCMYGLNTNDMFGYSVTVMGDFAADGTFNIAAGAAGTDDGGTDVGAMWIMQLEQANSSLALKSSVIKSPNGITENIYQSEGLEKAVLAIEKEKIQFYVFPNPYKENTTINYELKAESTINLEVYTMSGQKIHTIYNGTQTTGTYRYDFSAKRLGYASGTYLLKIIINNDINSYWLVEMK